MDTKWHWSIYRDVIYSYASSRKGTYRLPLEGYDPIDKRTPFRGPSSCPNVTGSSSSKLIAQ